MAVLRLSLSYPVRRGLFESYFQSTGTHLPPWRILRTSADLEVGVHNLFHSRCLSAV